MTTTSTPIFGFIERFLAFHSGYLLENTSTGHAVAILLESAEKAKEIGKDPSAHKDLVTWMTTDQVEQVMPGLMDCGWPKIKATTAPFLAVAVQVEKPVLNTTCFLINPRELYCEYRHPWAIKHADAFAMVELSVMQRDTFSKPELKTVFREVKGALEPVITSTDTRARYLEHIIASVVRHLVDVEHTIIDFGTHVLSIKFRDGDRDLLSALAGTIQYRYFEVVQRTAFAENAEVFAKLAAIQKPCAIIAFISNSDEHILYRSLFSIN